MVKKWKIIQQDPVILEIEFDPVPQKLLNYIYKEEHFEQQSFQYLEVEKGRLVVDDGRLDAVKLAKLKKHFSSSFKFITKTFVDIDVLRFPLFRSFEKWYKENQFDNKQVLNVTLDRPGFSQSFHLDNRLSMWAGSINLSDNESSTIFTTEDKNWISQGLDPSEYYYKASGKKFTGTFWINTENNWHAVPLVKSDRRVIVCNQMLAT